MRQNPAVPTPLVSPLGSGRATTLPSGEHVQRVPAVCLVSMCNTMAGACSANGENVQYHGLICSPAAIAAQLGHASDVVHFAKNCSFCLQVVCAASGELPSLQSTSASVQCGPCMCAVYSVWEVARKMSHGVIVSSVDSLL